VSNAVFSRGGLKSGLLACLIVSAACAMLQTDWMFAIAVKEALYLVATGSAVSAVAICLALIATV
jgi:hypothetical protein